MASDNLMLSLELSCCVTFTRVIDIYFAVSYGLTSGDVCFPRSGIRPSYGNFFLRLLRNSAGPYGSYDKYRYLRDKYE